MTRGTSKKRALRINVRKATPDDKIVGQRLRARRLEMHLSQADLGDKVGVSFQQIQKYERGTNRLGITRLMQFTTILETDHSYFLGDLGNERPPKNSKLMEFMTSKDGVAIAEAMLKMPMPALRRNIISLCRAIGGPTVTKKSPDD